MPTEIFQSHQRPIKMSKVELLQFLAWQRELIEHDDSMEGAITYGWSDEPGVYDVHAFLRTGNSMGQGGVTLIQAPEPEPVPETAPVPLTGKEYTVSWERQVRGDNPLEAAQNALELLHSAAPDAVFLVDGREIDLNDPPSVRCRLSVAPGLTRPSGATATSTHWDDDDNPYCDAHGAQPDPFDGEDI